MAQPQNKKNDSPDWYDRNIKFRGLVTDEKLKSSFIQIIGFILIGLGVFYLSAFLFIDRDPSNDDIAITFFIIMLGVAFAFPELLKGGDKEEGMSTMRIVVFMMTNVICLLLLKMGWKPEITSLKEIGLDQYWVGFIAFVFGAKATQYYFENMLGKRRNESLDPDIPSNDKETNTVNAAPVNIDSLRIANQAIQQNQDLKSKFQNIENMLIGSTLVDGQSVHCVDIHLNDNNSEGLPTFLTVQVANKDFLVVPVTIIENIGIAKTNISRGDEIRTASGLPGTLGCMVSDNNLQNIYALTCCHVFTDDQWIGYSGSNVPNIDIYNTDSGAKIGSWVFGIMNNSFDIAYVKIQNQGQVKPSGFLKPRNPEGKDILHRTPVSFSGAVHQNGNGVIRNYNCTRTIYYGQTPIKLSNLILISHDNTAPSSSGDSGSLVYTTAGNEPLGLVVAADAVFSYVIPITSILSHIKLNIY